MENAFWPPLKKFLVNRKEGPTATQTGRAQPNDVPCVLHLVQGLVRVRIRGCAMCGTHVTSDPSTKTSMRPDPKVHGERLSCQRLRRGSAPDDIPCVILTLSKLRDYPGQDTAYSLRIVT